MNYPIVIHKDADSDYGVTVPDLPGCFSAGKTLDEALRMAREAVELHLEGLIEAGEPIPLAQEIDRYAAEPDYAGGHWAFVAVDPESLRVKTQRVNVTIPERVLEALDRFAKERGESRSGLIVHAVAALMGRASDPAMRADRRGRKRRPRLARKER
jgi:predicted RNase H-like HicB family nuclease